MRKPKKKLIGLEHQTHVYLDAETRAALQKLAEVNDRSMTAEIRRAIRFYLENKQVAA